LKTGERWHILTLILFKNINEKTTPLDPAPKPLLLLSLSGQGHCF
jgi:hypothetical protein